MNVHQTHLSAQGRICSCWTCRHLTERLQTLCALWQRYVFVSQPTWTEGRYKTLYHGTSVADAQRMLQHGVSLPRQRGQISPGQFSYEGGFYLTDQPQGAAQFAQFKTGQPRVAVLAFRWDRSQMKILEFGQGRNMQGFMPYFIFSLTNWGEDITSVLPAHVFRQQRVGHFQRPMNLRELRRATAATLSMYDMVAGPMLRTGDTEAHVCQYAIVSARGLARLSKPYPKIYDCTPTVW